ncbi:MAG: phosphotransferase [Halanaerobiales bacterium]|nr:phosphotransferase [Halanaerobiales bacterium]
MGQSSLTLDQLDKLVKEYVKDKEFKDKLNLNNSIKVSFLAQGEYNINYIIEDSNQKYVMRINTGSQMNLSKQIEYEYKALKYLEKSGVTPKVFYLDDSRKELPLGMLIMEYLPGRSMLYKKDLKKAAEVLARVHQVEIKNDFDLIKENRPLTGIYKECSNLLPVYLNSDLGDPEVKDVLEKMLLILKDLRKKKTI